MEPETATNHIDGNLWAAPATHRSVTIGEYSVAYLPDGYVELDPQRWFSLPDGESIAESRPELISGNGYLIGSIGALLVSGPDLSVLIDAGFGPRHVPDYRSHPALGAMHGGGLGQFEWEPLTAACFTHLHEDHTGWLKAPGSTLHDALSSTQKRASPAELQAHKLMGAPGWRPVSGGQSVANGITVMESPGHTAGHNSYIIASQGQSLLCFGDVMHSAVQVERPQLNSCFEEDPRASLASRLQTLEFASDTSMLCAGMHFGDTVFGRVERAGSGFRWSPAC